MKKTTLIVALIVMISLLGFYQFWKKQQPNSDVPAPQSALILPQPRAIAAFNLIDNTGKTFTEENLKGQWDVLFFGYTSCPDVCPNTLNIMQQAWEILEKENETHNIRFVFVSVDPVRDSAEQLNRYVTYFNPQFMGLTGDEPQIQKLGEQFGVFYIQTPNKNDPKDYLIEHTGSVMFVDPDGHYYANLSPPFTAELLAHDVRVVKQSYQKSPGEN
jgi:protein SCO1/2